MKGRSLTPIVLAAGWLVSLGAVFVLGMLLAFAFHLKPGASSGDQATDASTRELEVFVLQLSGRPLDLSALHEGGSDEGIGEQFRTAFRNLLQIGEPVERVYKSRVLVQALPTRKMLLAVREVEGFPVSPMRDELLLSLLEEWGRRDGRSAMLFAAGGRGGWNREAIIGAVLSGWARTAPSEAADWVLRNPAGPVLDGERMGEIVWSVANKSVAEAFVLVTGVTDLTVRARAAMSLTDFLMQTGTLDRVAVWLEDLPDDPAKTQALSYAASRWADFDPLAALGWTASLGETNRVTASLAALETWSESDPEGALTWCLEAGDARLRRAAMSEIAARWVEYAGPAPLAEFINRHPFDPAFDGPISIIALESMAADPDTALRWAQSISDPVKRSATEAVIEQFRIGSAPIAVSAPAEPPATAAVAVVEEVPAVEEEPLEADEAMGDEGELPLEAGELDLPEEDLLELEGYEEPPENFFPEGE